MTFLKLSVTCVAFFSLNLEKIGIYVEILAVDFLFFMHIILTHPHIELFEIHVFARMQQGILLKKKNGCHRARN
jgi:hypothetical protein